MSRIHEYNDFGILYFLYYMTSHVCFANATVDCRYHYGKWQEKDCKKALAGSVPFP